MWKLALVVLGSVLAVACKKASPDDAYMCGDAAGATLIGQISTNQLGGVCGGPAGTGMPGTPCTKGSQCEPACCTCGLDGGNSVSVGYCAKGVCATVEEACCTFKYTQGKPDASQICP